MTTEEEFRIALAELSKKLDAISLQIEAVRKEARLENETMRAQVVSKEEYDPKHTFLVERSTKLETLQERQQVMLTELMKALSDHMSFSNAKIAEYDRVAADYRATIPTWYELMNDNKTFKVRLDKIEGRGATTLMKVYTTVAVAAGLVAIFLSLAQHITFR